MNVEVRIFIRHVLNQWVTEYMILKCLPDDEEQAGSA